jgi:SAM-dependent methyltransferase
METERMENKWFESWFDSPFYHLLYQNRDENEAEGFVKSLMQVLSLPLHSVLLDLACGKGRHSQFLHSLGHRVLGVDLAANSIAQAMQYKKEGLDFRVGDMREPQGQEEFDLVLNLFTSFGYFESEEDNIKVLEAIKTALKPGGLLLLDFMNTARVITNLIPESRVDRGEVSFQLRRFVENGRICKSIQFEADGRSFQFFERVQALSKDDFLGYFQKTGLDVVLLSGDYEMKPFDEARSERMIFLVRKP